VTNQERSIFQSNGMPLRFADNTHAGRAPSQAWMSPFSISQQAQTMSPAAGVLSGPSFDVPVDEAEPVPALPGTQETVVFQETSDLAAGRVDQLLAPSFSWPVDSHRPGSSVIASSGQVEPAGTSNQNPDPVAREQHQVHSPESMLAGSVDEPAQPRFDSIKSAPKAASDERRSGVDVRARTRDSGAPVESGPNPLRGELAARSTGDQLVGRREDKDSLQSLGNDKLGSLRLGRLENRSAAAVKVRASQSNVDLSPASPPQVMTSGHNWTANAFLGQKLPVEVLSPRVAGKSDAIEVLERLSFGASPAPAAPRPGRQVHIGKLHITVQRPAAAAPQQQPSPVAEARHTSQPPGHVFPNPWERHYSSFD